MHYYHTTLSAGLFWTLIYYVVMAEFLNAQIFALNE